jgi:hypothetical protein
MIRRSSLLAANFFRDQGSDHTFGFSPDGVHDIHMMQDKRGDFANDSRVNGDGAPFIRYAGGETVALFPRFSVPTADALTSINRHDVGVDSDNQASRPGPARVDRRDTGARQIGYLADVFALHPATFRTFICSSNRWHGSGRI